MPVVHRGSEPWIDLVRMGRFGFGFTNEEEAALGICKALEAEDSVRSGIVEWARKFSYESFRDGVSRIVGFFVA